MNPLKRIVRHARLTSYSYRDMDSPPFLVLFINSICNMKCEHCFYWTSLNKKDDLSQEEIFALSDSLGPIENLNLSGGEPFLRKEFGAICRKFIRTNGVKQIYVPTNGYFTERCIAAIRETLKEPGLELFVAEISLDGMPEFHDKFRVARHAFKKAMETYDALIELQKEDPRVRVHSISTATDVNMDEIKRLTTYLYERCPQMDHHNLAIIRGDRKNPTLKGPSLKNYEDLYEYIRRLWAPREQGRTGSAVEPMLQWAKVETVKQERQVVPCKAGKISGVVYANGDVGVCEIHKPIGNLRQKTFPEIWHSPEAKALRESIAKKECYCTTEVFMWSSIVYQPLPLLEATIKGKVWSKPLPLHPSERLPVSLADGPPPGGAPEPVTAEEAAY
ncbi:MAG: radical SAM protein [Gemmatimonadota bacterium]|nr:radical SAM protein [Gemmatimonadota bacterium]